MQAYDSARNILCRAEASAARTVSVRCRSLVPAQHCTDIEIYRRFPVTQKPERTTALYIEEGVANTREFIMRVLLQTRRLYTLN
jgi:hypothetical protein